MDSIKHSIRIPLYRAKVEFYIGSDLNTLARKYKLDVDDDKPSDGVMAFTFVGTGVAIKTPETKGMKGSKFIMFLRPNATPDTVTHECFHLAAHVYEWMGASIGTAPEEHEPFAYLLGWVATEANKALAKYHKQFPIMVIPVDS